MKKILMVLISLVLIGSITGTVGATDYNESQLTDGYGQSTLTLNTENLEAGFTLSIPDTIELSYVSERGVYEAEADVVLKVITSNTEANNLTVSVKSKNHFQLFPYDEKDSTNPSMTCPYNLTTTDWRGVTQFVEGWNVNDTLDEILVYSPSFWNSFNGEFKTTLTFVYNSHWREVAGLNVIDTLTFNVKSEPDTNSP